MHDLLTEAVRERLRVRENEGRPQDLYLGAGAEFFEHLVGPDRTEVREVLRFARDVSGRVLDLAAGGGRLTIPLLRAGHDVAALDLSEDMLAHLARAAGAQAHVTIHVGDMSDFSLGAEFGLIVIGATSISLLDARGRRGLLASVRRHLAPGGRLVFSVPSEPAADALSLDAERVIPLSEGGEHYLFSQQASPSGAERLVNFVRMADLGRSRDHVPVYTSRLQLVRPSLLQAELVEAGFAAPEIHAVRSSDDDPAHRLVLLATTLRDAP